MAGTDADTSTALDGLARARLPLAWVSVLAFLLVPLGNLLLTSPSGVGILNALLGPGTWPSPFHALLILVLVWACALWRPLGVRARPVAVAAAVIITLSVLLVIAAAVVAVVDNPGVEGFSIWYSAALVLPVSVIAVALWVTQAGLTQPTSPASRAAPAEIEAEVPLHQQPAWRPDQASGAAWQSASGAAQGSRASGWGAPGRPRGTWDPAPGGIDDTSASDEAAERAALERAGTRQPPSSGGPSAAAGASQPTGTERTSAAGAWSASSWSTGAGGRETPTGPDATGPDAAGPDSTAPDEAPGTEDGPPRRAAPDWGA